MKALKFFTDQLQTVALRRVSDKNGWETGTDYVREVLALPQAKMSGIDPEASMPYALQATVEVFVHLSSRSVVNSFTVGDGVIVDGLEYEILEIVKVESGGLGKVFFDFPVKIVGVRK